MADRTAKPPADLLGARADLHVHSAHSNRPDEWVLRSIAAPESFTDPRALYDRCRARGMDFVTISDHDTVTGALEIAHLPGVFLSSEVTARFPEDGCAVHCLVLGVTEGQHREIQRLRGDLYALRDYLVDEDVLHSVAHPLFRVDGQLTLEHVEKLVVLFKRFEVRNGIHDQRLNGLAEALLAGLTPEIVAELADRHRLDPRDPEPWIKHTTGGSDDHGGLYMASTWTETPPAATVDELLGHLRAGRSAAGGATGTSLRLARSLCAISWRYFQERFAGGLLARRDPFARMLAALGRPPRPVRRRLFFRTEPPAPNLAEDEAALGAADRLCARALGRFVVRAGIQAKLGRFGAALGAVSELAPLAALAPFAVAFDTQAKDEDLLGEVAERFRVSRPDVGPERLVRKAWVSDTLSEVNGVTRTVAQVSRAAARADRSLLTLSCEPPAGCAADWRGPRHLLESVARFPLPGYESLTLSIPRLLELVRVLERQGIGEVVISTPGPVGLAALVAARLLRLRVTGVYHTDFPRYVRDLTGDPALEAATWTAMRWVYGAMDRIYVPSRSYGEQLGRHGFDPDRLVLMPRGVDTALFHPGRRAPELRRRWAGTLAGGTAGGAADGTPVVLYAGRLSKEKNLDLLLDAFDRLLASGRPARLVLVGDGPDRERLAARADGSGRPEVVFTGFLHGTELATAYASADLFAFPSVTDTFGNAVLEAHASGLAAVVTGRGGPREIVARRGSGVVAEPSPDAFAAALDDLLGAPARRSEMARRALATAREASWDLLVDRLWGDTPDEPARALDPCPVPGAIRRPVESPVEDGAVLQQEVA